MDIDAIIQQSTRVPLALWRSITPKSNIVYVLAGEQPLADRFRIGGYVKSTETEPRASITTATGVIYLDELEEIYKLSDPFNIEFYLTTQSLLTMSRRIEKLEKQIKTLMNMIDREGPFSNITPEN